MKVDELRIRITEDELFLSKQEVWNRLTLVDKLLMPLTRPTLVPMDLVFDIKPSRNKKLLEAPIGTVKRLRGAQQVVPIAPFIKSSAYQVHLIKQSTSKLPPEYAIQSRRHR